MLISLDNQPEIDVITGEYSCRKYQGKIDSIAENRPRLI